MNNLKKILTGFAALTVLVSGTSVFAQDDIKIYVDDKCISSGEDTILECDRTLVPLRKIFESLGAKVDWTESTETACATKDNTEVKLQIGNNKMTVNGQEIPLDVCPVLKSDKTYVPVRAISEALNCNVNWNGSSNIVNIVTGDCANGNNQNIGTTIKDYLNNFFNNDNNAENNGNSNQDSNNGSQNNSSENVKPSDDATAFEQEVFRLVNEIRKENGLTAFAYNNTLANVARAHSKDMAENGYFSHTGLDGSSVGTRVSNAGISWSYVAENIAAGQQTPQSVVDGWMNSAGHRANILSTSAKEIGVGVHFGGSYGIYWTQNFATVR